MDDPENPYAPPQEITSPFVPPGLTAHRGQLVFVLGISGILLTMFGCLLCGPLGFIALGLTIPAWIMGQSDLRAMDAGTMDPSGRAYSSAGMIMGIVATVLNLLGILITVVFFGVVFLIPLFQ